MNPLLFNSDIVRLNGMPMHASPYLLPNYTSMELPPSCRNRSRRLVKKLMRQVRQKAFAVWTEMLMILDPISGQRYLVCHPTVYRKLMASIESDVRL